MRKIINSIILTVFDYSLRWRLKPLAYFGLISYKLFISPVRRVLGFRCAHEVMHKDGSCSIEALKLLWHNNCATARTAIFGRLWECRVAASGGVNRGFPTPVDRDCCPALDEGRYR